MSYLEAILLGIVQGVTEFLPISSSGHLVIFEKIFAQQGDMLGFNVAVHIGTLLSVLTVYRKTLLQLVWDLKKLVLEKKVDTGARLFFFVFLASIPTGLMGFLLRDFWRQMFASLLPVGICLCITAVLLWSTRHISSRKGLFVDQMPGELDGLTWKKALLIGLVQGFAIAPGISRSGSTISAAIILGCDRHIAALFSFLLMIPAIIGATGLELTGLKWSPEMAGVMLAGLVSAYFSGIIGLKIILKTVKNGRLEFFSPYLLVVGSLTIGYAVFY